MNNLESFTDFHKRKRKDCIESLDSMYAEHYGGLEETEFVTDLIADLMHWAKANKLYDFNLYIERAKSYHNIEWNGLDNSGYSVSSGMYIYSLKGEGVSITKKMVMMK